MQRETKLIHHGRPPTGSEQGVNHAVHRASTIEYPDLHSYLHRFDGDRRFNSVTYGATGTRNARALAAAVAELEGAAGTVVTASGLSACTVAIAALVEQGDHVLLTDSVYGPTRRFCSEILQRFGVTCEYYDPAIGADIARLCRPSTRLVFVEAPGSLTMEMQDIRAISRAAHAHGALVAMDNTWATPLFYQPLANDVDVSIQAGTKYIAGHSDLVIGLISCADRGLHERVADYAMTIGDVAGPDDCFLALRGLRTLALRVQRQFDSALEIARWLQNQPQVQELLYPPLPGDRGHELWSAQMSGGASLFGMTLVADDIDATARFVNHLQHFNIGSSWGGFESLVAANVMPLPREVIPWQRSKVLLRLHIGLEHPNDLIADLQTALAKI